MHCLQSWNFNKHEGSDKVQGVLEVLLIFKILISIPHSVYFIGKINLTNKNKSLQHFRIITYTSSINDNFPI